MTTPGALRKALLCLCLAAPGCDAELYHGLPERQANRAVVGLREAGFAADKRAERGGRATFTLTVPRAEEGRALRALEERGLVRAAAPRPAPGLLPLPEEARAARAQELGEQIAATLEALPQVLEARVHLTLPAEDPLRPADQGRGGAAVLLRLRGPLPVPQAEVERLVARAAPGLSPGDVTVMTALAPAPAAGEPPYARVGPLLVAPGSQRLAAALLGALCLLGAALLLLLARRRPAT